MALSCIFSSVRCVFFFNDTATTEIYTLSLHDALPISLVAQLLQRWAGELVAGGEHGVLRAALDAVGRWPRSEEHTSELQSRQYLVCRLLLEKKKQTKTQSSVLSTPLAIRHHHGNILTM